MTYADFITRLAVLCALSPEDNAHPLSEPSIRHVLQVVGACPELLDNDLRLTTTPYGTIRAHWPIPGGWTTLDCPGTFTYGSMEVHVQVPLAPLRRSQDDPSQEHRAPREE